VDKRGFTLVETVMAVAVGLLALGAMTAMFVGIRKMAGQADIAATLQEGSLAMASLQKDLTQAVQKPDPTLDSAVIVKAGAFQMVRGEFAPDGTVKGGLVVYRTVGTPGGLFRLVRTHNSSERRIPGLFKQIKFVQLRAAGGPYVRVTMKMAAQDTATSAQSTSGSQEAVLTSLTRIQGPEMITATAFSWSQLEALTKIEFLKDF
jgi:prepilin-type N-terminal cleavage/methylation domain-containing protein